MSCMKTVELIEMQFRMLSQVGSENMTLHGNVDAPRGLGTFGVCD